MVVLAAVKEAGQATIKSVAVASPVIGSQSTFGRVDLTAPAVQPVVITLTTNDMQRGRPPASVTVAAGQSMQTFVIKAEPVAAPTTVTLTARTPGSPDATANFTVMPPNLAILDCEPKSIAGSDHATCKAWMDGIVANGATPQIAIASSNPQVVYFSQPTVTVPAGSRWVTFDAIARDLPQSATATISASYAGVIKSSNLTVTPAAISRFGCVVVFSSPDTAQGQSECSVVGGDFSTSGYHQYVGWAVHLTAPAPYPGYKIPLAFSIAVPTANGPQPASPFDLSIPKTLEVPTGKNHALYPFPTTPGENPYIIKVTAKDPITHNTYDTQLTVNPPGIRSVKFQSNTLNNVPLGGKDVQVEVEFMSKPPKHGIAYDVTYSGTTDIKGPARVRIDPGDYSTDRFTVKVFPCAVNPPCHVSVTLGGKAGGATVTP
jgi:hypothetical protein